MCSVLLFMFHWSLMVTETFYCRANHTTDNYCAKGQI